MNSIAIIGAGAAGMMAAITAASLGSRVTLYEMKARIGQKILATGNGKCNLSNMKMGAGEFYSSNPAWVENILAKFSVADTTAFFNRLGVMIREKNGGLYPYSEQAQVVLDALRLKLAELGVVIICEKEVTAVKVHNDGLFAVGDDIYDKVIIACGSKAAQKKGAGESGYQIVKDLGHEIIHLVPGLCKLFCREDFLKAMAGVRCPARLTLRVNGAENPIQAETG
jgi:predicted Rossmann fold flavoprotein